jgi:hypothetical protein
LVTSRSRPSRATDGTLSGRKTCTEADNG